MLIAKSRQCITRIVLIASIAVGAYQGLQSQDFSRFSADFIVDGVPLRNALAGGLQNGQFSSIDLNQDNLMDLFVFDTAGDRVMTYINCGAPGDICYQYAPEYAATFPTDLQSWALMRDYNDDGVEDIFSGFSGGVRLHKGARLSDGSLSYALVPFPAGAIGFDIIEVPAGGGYKVLYVAGSDIPAIEDVDGDGDLDILSFGDSGTKVVYYRNYAKEFFLTDTIVMREEDPCFGRFIEGGLSADISLSDNCIDCAVEGINDNKTDTDSRNPVHAGSTISAFDADGDGDLELLLGDLATPGLVYLENGGDNDFSCMTAVDNTFPSYDVPAEISLFLTSFFIDANNDGLNDLIVTTNVPQQNVNHIWLYINIGSADRSVFQLEDRSFLIDEMLHMGFLTGSTFTDYNHDGIMDLITAGAGFKDLTGPQQGAFMLWENTGTASVPEFTLVDDNLLQMRQRLSQRSNLMPTAADLDADGDDDLIIGDTEGQLYYSENVAPLGQPAEYSSVTYPYPSGEGIFVGQNAMPALHDIDEDGDLDLIIGEGFSNKEGSIQGSLNWYKNTGTSTQPVYGSDPTSRVLYHFQSSQPGQSFNYTDPEYLSTPDGVQLLTGSNFGTIYQLTDVVGTDLDTAIVITDQLGGIDVGRRSTISAADLDNDGYYELLVGNIAGGFEMWNTDILYKAPTAITPVNAVTTGEVILSPIPAKRSDVLAVWHTGGQAVEPLRVYDVMGRSYSIEGSNGKIEISHLRPGGIYFLRVGLEDGTTIIKKFIVID